MDQRVATDTVITGGLCLLPGEGLVRADVACSGGRIAHISRDLHVAGARRLDASNCLVLPGIVDIHGDAFERQILPRPKTVFPFDIAVLETDRQLVANGITTAYHGITISWEPGLRSLDAAMRLISVLDRMEKDFLADNRIHIRWETFALDEMAEVQALFSRPKTPLLAFNDHTSPTLKGSRSDTKIRGAAERALMDVENYNKLLAAAGEREAEVMPAIERMARSARAHDVPLLSHDDTSIDMRRFYRSLGAATAEFPMNEETLTEAVAGGDDIVLGSPNVVRGGSHNGAISAETAIRNASCTILASDYYYPAPLAAAMSLSERGVMPLEQAWALVSDAPARACGLLDRGRIAEGMRADLVVLPEAALRPVSVVVAGKVVFDSR